MRVLVTGGAGFLGSALVDRLLAEGHRVDVLDDLSTGSLTNLAPAREQVRSEASGRLKIHQGDVCAAAAVEVLVHHAPDVVVHLAGPTTRADRDPAVAGPKTVQGALRVLTGAAAAGARRVVCVAGARDQADPVRGVADRAVQEYLAAFAEVHGIERATVVLPTVFGPRQLPTVRGAVVAVFVHRLLAGEPCALHGGGTPRRDLLYVDDAVDALVRAVDAPDGTVAEVGSGTPVAVAELHARIAAIAGVVDPVAVAADARAGEPGTVAVDPTAARHLLDWRPWTSLDDGLRATLSAAGRT